MTNSKMNKTSKSGELARRVQKVERYISTHRGDIKAINGAAAITPSTTGTTFFVSAVAQDDTLSGRTGSVINLQHFTFGVLAKMTATCSVRVAYFFDTMNQGAVPSISEVLDGADVISPPNYANTTVQKRFIFIDDRVMHFSVNGTLSDSYRIKRKLQRQIRYNGSSSNVTSALSNNIFGLMVADTNTAGQVSFYSRMEFTDE